MRFLKTSMDGFDFCETHAQLRSIDPEPLLVLPPCVGGVEMDFFKTNYFHKFAQYEYYDNIPVFEI